MWQDDGLRRRTGAFTSFTRVVSTRRGRGWFLFRFRGHSDRFDRNAPRRRQFGGKKFAPLVVDAIAEDKARAVAILQERRLKREEREREMRVLYESSTML